MTGGRTVRVLVAEGSVVDRERLVALLQADTEVAVVGAAARCTEVLTLAKRLRPDVIVMGANLPSIGGFEATKEIMIETPTPIVIVADAANKGLAQVSMMALRAGALTIQPRPSVMLKGVPDAIAQRFIATVKAMSEVKVVRHWPDRGNIPQSSRRSGTARIEAIAIAASTGGPGALQQLLSQLPLDFPVPILVVQHIAAGFVEALASWLNSICPLKVKIAMDGEPLLARTVYVAPDNRHLGVVRGPRITLSAQDPVDGFRPSASFLFESVAKIFGAAAIHVVLTGMGQDGVSGLAAVRSLGGKVMAQDEASSVVFGMPGAAIAAGLVDHVLPLSAIVPELTRLSQA